MVWIQAPENWERVAPVKDNAPAEFDEPVEFNDSGSANITEKIAEYLVEEYEDEVSYKESDSE